jgi:hypothetical protein
MAAVTEVRVGDDGVYRDDLASRYVRPSGKPFKSNGQRVSCKINLIAHVVRDGV